MKPNPASAATARGTPTPIPAFAPVVIAGDETGVDELVGDELVLNSGIAGHTDEASVMGMLVEEEVKDLVVLELVEEVDPTAPRRTRKPGLDKSTLFGSYFGPAILNRRTYLASDAKILSGMAMVQA